MKGKKKALSQLFLRTTGGMGISLEGRVDIDTLPDDLARQVETELTPRKLSRVARRKAASFVPGQQEYEIALVTEDDRELKRYAFTDQQADPALLDLLDEIAAAIIQEKMRTRRARRQTPEPEEVGGSHALATPIPAESTFPDAGTALVDIAEPPLNAEDEHDGLAEALPK